MVASVSLFINQQSCQLVYEVFFLVYIIIFLFRLCLVRMIVVCMFDRYISVSVTSVLYMCFIVIFVFVVFTI